MKRLLAVKASAGSGKTFRLANRYISLLSVDNPVNIIAITFTNKASNEMKERIVKFLKELGNDENVLNMVCSELNISKGELLEKKNRLLRAFLNSDINIQTIDSFINKILRKFSYFAGVRSGFDIGGIDREVVFSKFLNTLKDREFLELIDVAKRENNFYNLVELFEILYEKDKELKNITLTPFSKPDDKKAKKAFLRLKDFILNSSASKQAKGTFNIEFYDAYKSGWFCKESLNYWHFKKIYEEWFDECLVVIQNYFKDYFNYVEYSFFESLFKFYNKYKEIKWNLKKDENRLDFKDIEHLVYELLREKLDKEFLYFRLDSKMNHILLDEFQDTSVTQWEIFEPIVTEIASGIGRREFRSFFYVGDIKQAIYRFRGGEKELFEKVALKYKPYGLEVEELNVNYRSAKNIVEFVNEKFNLKEKAHRKERGYVEVDEATKEEMFDKLYEKIEFLIKNGVKESDIAVLVHKNDDILDVGDFFKSKGKKVITTKTKKVISQPNAKAVISLMKYLNNNTDKIELLNFLSLIGKKWGEVEVDIQIKRPLLMIKEIMDKFDLTDESTLRLLYHSRKYDTLVDFVDKIDEWDEEMPLKEFDGIVVMTIHKSKGLEFKHTIVLDRLSRENNKKGNIVFYYEDAKLKKMKLKFKNREFVDEEYKKIVDKEKELEIEDKKNLEYVAFTRAENSLIILKRAEVTKKGESKSAFVSTLEKCIIGGVIPSQDNKHSFEEEVEVEIQNYGKQELKVKEEEYKPNDFEAIYLGNAIHYAFECGDIEAVRNRYGDFCDIDEVKEKVEKAKPLIPNGKKEVPFIFKGNVGRIDLLVEGEEIVIIDYKSTRPHDERAYIKQVRGYIEAVEKITGKKARGKLFYVDEREFKEV
ncbi:MAG: RecB-like helicase [Nautiliaceae bacterium]